MPLAEHLAVGSEHHRVRAAWDCERLPGLGVVVLVEEPELDLRVAGEQAQRRLECRAERAAGEVKTATASGARRFEALDQPDAPTELRAFVVERERGLRGDREPQLADLAGQREERDRQCRDADERDAQADAEPGLGRERGVGQERQHANAAARQAERTAAPQPIRDRLPKQPHGWPGRPRAIATTSSSVKSPSRTAAASAAPGTPAATATPSTPSSAIVPAQAAAAPRPCSP